MIKYFTHLLPLLLISLSAYGQNAAIDSLRDVLNQKPSDSLRASLLLEMGHQFKGVSIDSVDHYYFQSLQAATCEQCIVPKLNSLVALNLLKGYQKDTVAISYGIRALAISKALNNPEKTAQILNGQGLALLKLGRIDLANEWLYKAAYSSKKNNLYNDAGKAHSNLGYIFTQKAIYDSAAVHFRTALAFREKAGQKASQQALLNLGVVYFKSANTEMAHSYYEKALKASIEDKDHVTEASCYQNLGALYTKTGALEKSLEYLGKAHEIYQRRQDSSAMATYYASIADIHLKQKEEEKALQAYLNAKDIFPSNGSPSRELFVHLNLSRTYLRHSELTNKPLLEKAIEEGLVANELAHLTLNTANQLESASILFKAYQGLGQFEKASTFASETIELRDSLLNEQKINAIAEVQEKYETEKRNLEIDLLNKDNELKEQELTESIKAQKRQLYIIVGVLIVLLLSVTIASLLFRQGRQRKKTNALLTEQKSTIEKQKQQVESTLKEITKRDEEKELLLKEIHHRVKNNLQVISSLLELQAKKGSETEKTALEEGQSRVRAMALIHEKLYSDDNLAEIDISEYTRQLSQQISAIYQTKKVNVQIDAQNLRFDIDTAVPLGLVLNELITNAYKYAFKAQGGQLHISVKSENGTGYQLRVKDNGAGMPDDFDFDKARSLGLRLVKRLSKQLYGSAQYQNAQGAEFKIAFKDTIQRKEIA